jgi:hypothetical protein
MKRSASLLAALLCLMLSAHAANAQSDDETQSVDETTSSQLPEPARALHDSKVAAGQIIEPFPGESQRDFVARARSRFEQRSQGTGQSLPSSTSARRWRDAASSPYSPASTPVSRGLPGAGVAVFLLFALIIVVVMKMYRGAFRLARIVSTSAPREDQPLRELDHMFFDQHVAKRLAELQAGGPVEEAADAGSAQRPSPPMAAPAPIRGFGRKV